MERHFEILSFINRWKEYAPEEPFRVGLCYWFAFILQHRFGGDLFYDARNGHFVTCIKNKFYDITGVVKKTPGLIEWTTLQRQDPIHAERIRRDCIILTET